MAFANVYGESMDQLRADRASSGEVFAGKLTAATLRYMRVWISERDRWQIAGGHMSVVP